MVEADAGVAVAAPRAAVTLDGVLREILREVVREQIPAIAEAVVVALRAEAGPAVPASSDSSYLTVADAAAHVGVSAKTIRGWVRAGKLRALSAGRLLRIERGELERFATAAANGGGTTDTEAVAADILARRKR